MQIQVHTDKNIDGHESFAGYVQTTIADSLSHFDTHITSVQVHLSDENGDKGGSDDKRCLLEARLEGRPPTAVTCEAATVELAIAGAADKLKHSLESTLDRLYEHRS